MKRFLLFITLLLLHLFLAPKARAQTNQTIANGAATTAVTFPGTGCIYNWVNNTPGIGLAASGTGNIPSFTAVNTGSAPVTATITATPINAGFAYVGNATSGNVSVINTATNTIITTVPVADPYGVAVSPDGSRVYFTAETANIVSVMSTTTNTVIASIPVGNVPAGIALSHDGTRAYVAINGGVGTVGQGTISVINTATNQVIGTMVINASYNLYDLAISPDGARLYVSSSAGIAVVNTVTSMVITTIATMNGFSHVTMSPDGNRLYVLNDVTNTLSVINTATNVVAANVFVGSSAGSNTVSVSPDGSKVYVSSGFPNRVTVINASTNTIVSTIPLSSDPYGISFTPDGSRLYVTCALSNFVWVINAIDNSIITVIPVGTNPFAVGNFITSLSCAAPVTFTITVNPTIPFISPTAVTGTISTCAGTASASPNVQQFSVSAGYLTGNITTTAPAGFEVSLGPVSGYSNSLTIAASAGTVTAVAVYVRASATAAAGNITGNVVLTSGTINQNVQVTGVVNAIPTASVIGNQSVLNGSNTAAINFTGTADTFTWVNDMPGIGLAASGTGNIASFTAINGGATPVTATFTVIPVSAAGCAGTPATFTITVNPSPVISTIGSVSALKTTYGTPSTTNSFTITGINLRAGVLVAPPAGFEVSTDNISFSKTLTAGGPGINVSTLVYIRLTATTNAGNYSGNIVLSSAGGSNINLSIPLSTVSPAPLTISASDISKPYGTALTSGISSTAFTATGLKNAETVASITENFGRGSATGDPGGFYAASVMPLAATGGTFIAGNYTITYLSGEIVVSPAPLTITADNEKKVFGTANPFLTVTYNGFLNNDSPANLVVQPVVTTTASTNSPVGAYPIVASGASSPSYTIIYVPGVLTIEPGTIVVPNAFTPNGDGINDTWDIKYIENYPNSTVQIFNRHGQSIFYSIKYAVAWNGKYNGTDLPAGTYYYIINLNNGSKTLSGWVAVIR